MLIISTFVHYIAKSQRQELVHIIQVKKFFSLLLDGSTDTGNVDNELILLMWFSCSDEMVHTYTSYFKICWPSSVSAEGLFCMLQEAIRALGIVEIDEKSCSKLLLV